VRSRCRRVRGDAFVAELEGEVAFLDDPGFVVGVSVEARAVAGSLLSRISEMVAPWSAPLRFPVSSVALMTGM
jgi:hypothetical protein